MDSANYSLINIDPYALRHLAQHLLNAGRADELYALVTGAAWPQRAFRYDPSGYQYEADVRLAFRAIEQLIDAESAPAEMSRFGQQLARMAALAWLSATLGYSASRVPAAHIEMLARMGQVDQAVQRAERIPDAVLRAEALGLSGLAILDTSPDRAYALWIQANDMLRETPTELFDDKYETWASLITQMAQIGQVDTARSAAMELAIVLDEENARDGMILSSVFVGLAEAWGAIDDIERAAAVVRRLGDSDEQIKALCAIAKHMTVPKHEQATTLLDMALSLASTTMNRSARQALAERLAECGRWNEARDLLGDNPNPLLQCRLLLSAAIAAFHRNETIKGQSFLKKGLAILDAIDSRNDQVDLLSDLIHQLHLPPAVKIELRQRLRELAVTHRAQVSLDQLARAGLELAKLGEHEVAHDIVSALPTITLPQDDWDEQQTLIVLARVFGTAHEMEGLAWALECTRGRGNKWQQAELAYEIAQAAQLSGEDEIARQAERVLLNAAEDGHEGNPWHNTKAVLALRQKRNGDTAAALKTLDRAFTQLQKTGQYEGTAYLARALAILGDWPEGTRQAIQRTLVVLKDTTEPDVQARVLGIAAEAAALSGEGMWSDLRVAAAKIDEVWFRAEALFWLAGWQAISGQYAEGCQAYLDATSCELWLPVDPDAVKLVMQEGDLDYVASVAASAAWPSIIAAAIFAGLAVALQRPKDQRRPSRIAARIEHALEITDEIPMPYSYVRAFCYQVIVQRAKCIPDPRHAILHYWTSALRRNSRRDPGEVWVAIGAGISALYADLGPSFVKALWSELAHVQGILPQLFQS